MRPDIKERRECSYHRSEAFEIGSPPPLSGAGEDMSERPRRQPSASSRRSPSPSAFVAAVPSLRWGLRAVTLATRYRRSRSAPSLRLPLVDASEMSSSRRRTSAAPIPASWPATAPASSPRHTPTSSKYEKKGGVAASLRDVKMSDSQAVLHGLQRRTIQRLGRIRHRKIEEPDRLSVTVLALHHGTSAPSTRNLGRRRVTLGNSP